MSTVDDVEKTQEMALLCPRCDVPNQPQRRFCAQCGGPLRETCLECGEVCAAGENYCGACGASLDEVAAHQQEQLDADFITAREMGQECRFDEAIALLVPITKVEHPRLAECGRRAKQIIRQLTAQRDRRRRGAEEAHARARQCFDACDYDGAAQAIAEVPPAFQIEAAEQLRAQIATRQRETAELTEAIHQAVREKRFAELPSLIQRLLALKPDHAYARRLAQQVEQHLIGMAKQRLADREYEEARRLLAQIDPHVRPPQVQQLFRRVTELAWLAQDLRNAPTIDKTLLAVADRLRQLAPGDPQVAKLCDELLHRSRAAESQPLLEPPLSARPPEETPLGVPVDWLTGLRRMACAAGIEQSDLPQNPGRFAVACGLALAGLKQDAVQINLLANERKHVLHHVTRLMQSAPRSAWGIDIGASGLKAVELTWNAAAGQAVVESATVIEHAKSLRYAGNEDEEANLVTDTLEAFLENHDVKSGRVCVGVPGRMAISRQIELPSVSPAKMQKLVRYEAAQQFPISLEELAWDFQVLEQLAADSEDETESWDGQTCRVLLIAARRTTATRAIGALRELGVRVDVVQPDFVALHNFLAYEYFPSDEEEPSDEPAPVLAALDVGSDVTNVVVSSPNSLWFRSCGVAGQSFTRALVGELQLSIVHAEQLKRSPEAAERLSDLYQSLAPVFDDFLKELQESLSVYERTEPKRPIQRIVGLGGGFSLHGLLRFLRYGP